MSESRDYGRRLLITLIDQRARARHPRPYASIPRSNNATAGYLDISYERFANAINRCARWIQQQEGLQNTIEPLVYAGPNDLRYQIICMASVKTGNVMFFVSPRNSIEAHLALLDQAQTHTFLVPKSAKPAFVEQVAKQRSIRQFELPDLEELLDETPVEHIPYSKSFDEVRMEPWLILHTSGSTGTPKIVTLRHGYPTTADAYWLLWHNELAERCGDVRIFAPFPAFHVAGIIYSLMVVPYVDSTLVLPPTAPLTAEVVNSVHVHGRVETSSIPPSLIVDMTKQESYLENLKKLRGLTFAGGPLAKPVGDMLCGQMPLHTSLGATEFGTLPMQPKSREDWAYFNFNAEVGGMEFRDTGNGELFELVLVRDPRLDLFQAVFVTFPDIDEYHTKDTFSRHPSKPGLWRYEGRLDDILVLSNGEKVNPVTMEGIITSCPAVDGCVVFGQGRFQTGLLVQPKTYSATAEESSHLLEIIWPFIDRANRGCVRHGRIAKDMVTFTSDSQPLPRAPKGTIQRQQAYNLYKEQIDQAYDSSHTGQNHRGLNLDLNDKVASIRMLQRYLQATLNHPDIRPEDDLFNHGLDSLEVISLIQEIRLSIPDKRPIEPKDIYDNPTIVQLVDFLQNMAKLDTRDSEEVDRETWKAMEESFQSAVKGLPGYRDEKSGLLGCWKSSQTRWLIPPDGGTVAWLQVLGSLLINFNNWGLANSFGVFQAFYETELLSDWSPSSIAWIGTLQASLILIIGVISGPLFDKGYFTPILATSSVCLVMSLILLSFATQYYQVMLAWGVLAGICTGLLYIPSVAMIPLYFTSHRGLALGLATSGASIGGVIYPIVVRRIIASAGYPWACRAMGFISLTTLGVAFLLIKPPRQGSKKPARQLFDGSTFKDLPFVAFMVAAFLLFVGFLVPFILTPVYAQQGLSHSASSDTAFYLVAVINAAQFFGRIIPGLVTDSKVVGAETLMAGANVTAAILALCWIAVRSLGEFVVFLIIYGFCSGMIATLPAAVLPYLCPTLAVLGTRMGMVYACAGVGALIGTPVALAVDGKGNSFLGAQLWTGLTLMAGAIFFSITALEARQRRKIIDAGSRLSKGVV